MIAVRSDINVVSKKLKIIYFYKKNPQKRVLNDIYKKKWVFKISKITSKGSKSKKS